MLWVRTSFYSSKGQDGGQHGDSGIQAGQAEEAWVSLMVLELYGGGEVVLSH